MPKLMRLSAYYVEYAGKTAEDNLGENVEPLLSLFGYYTGSGLFNTAETHSILGFDVGIKAAIAMVGDNLKTDWEGVGGVKGGPLGEYSTLPLPLIHAGIGLGSNIEIIGRAFSYPIAETAEGESENITLIGAGIKYGVVQNMLLPRVSVIASFHKLLIPDKFEFANVQTISLDLIVSKGIPFVATFYGGVGIDRASMTVDLKKPISESFDYTQSMFRGVVGVKFDFIPFVFINADYNFGVNQGVNVGLGLNLR